MGGGAHDQQVATPAAASAPRRPGPGGWRPQTGAAVWARLRGRQSGDSSLLLSPSLPPRSGGLIRGGIFMRTRGAPAGPSIRDTPKVAELALMAPPMAGPSCFPHA